MQAQSLYGLQAMWPPDAAPDAASDTAPQPVHCNTELVRALSGLSGQTENMRQPGYTKWAGVSALLHALLLAAIVAGPMLFGPEAPASPLPVITLSLGGYSPGEGAGGNMGIAEAASGSSVRQTDANPEPVPANSPDPIVIPEPEPVQDTPAEPEPEKAVPVEAPIPPKPVERKKQREPRSRTAPQKPARPATHADQSGKADGPQEPQQVAQAGGEGASFGGSGPPSGQRGGASGSGFGAGDAGDEYVKAHYAYIQRRIKKHLVYPAQARRMGLQGTTTVSFIIQHNGEARDIRVVRSCGHESIDQAAVEAVTNASPFPAPPKSARIIIPIRLSLT